MKINTTDRSSKNGTSKNKKLAISGEKKLRKLREILRTSKNHVMVLQKQPPEIEKNKSTAATLASNLIFGNNVKTSITG